MAKYVMALDAGTTSNRCILFDEKGTIISMAQKNSPVFPETRLGRTRRERNMVDHAWRGSGSHRKRREPVHRILPRSESPTREKRTIVWDKTTGEPVCPAIVWQCRRTAEYCDQLKEKGMVDFSGKRQVL